MSNNNTFQSKADNPKVREVYDFASESHDTDYYWMGIGGERLLGILAKFSLKDWKELEIDLKNWSIEQVETFTVAVLNSEEGCHHSDDLEFPSKRYDTFLGFFNLLIPLLKYKRVIDGVERNIRYYIYEDFKFVEHYAPILAKYDNTITDKLKRINEILCYPLHRENSFREKNLSKSDSVKVLNIYARIINHESYDKYEPGQYDVKYMLDEIHRLFLNFEIADWHDLQKDIINWTSIQQKKLADCLIGDWTSHFPYDIYSLYGFIFTLVEDCEAEVLLERFHLIEKHGNPSVELIYKMEKRLYQLEKYTIAENRHYDYQIYHDLLTKMLNHANH